MGEVKQAIFKTDILNEWKADGSYLMFYPLGDEAFHTSQKKKFARSVIESATDFKLSEPVKLVEANLFPVKGEAGYLKKAEYVQHVMHHLDQIEKLDKKKIEIIKGNLEEIAFQREDKQDINFAGFIGLIWKICHCIRQLFNGFGLQTKLSWENAQVDRLEALLNKLEQEAKFIENLENTLQSHVLLVSRSSFNDFFEHQFTFENLRLIAKTSFFDQKSYFDKNAIQQIGTTVWVNYDSPLQELYANYHKTESLLDLSNTELTNLPNPIHKKTFEVLKANEAMIPEILKHIDNPETRSNFVSGLIDYVMDKENRKRIINYCQPEKGTIDTLLQEVLSKDTISGIEDVDYYFEGADWNVTIAYRVNHPKLKGYLFSELEVMRAVSDLEDWQKLVDQRNKR